MNKSVFIRFLRVLRVPLTITLTVVFGACREIEYSVSPAPISYTTLIYMAADNDMDSQVDYTLNQLKAGAKRSAGTVAVYLDRKDAPPRLFSITQQGEEMPLRSYEESNSASVSHLSAIIEDTKSLVPASRFGLIIWSHGMGWLPQGHSGARSAAQPAPAAFPQTRYLCFDRDDGANTTPHVMEIAALALALALPDSVAEYIWFDACLMGSVETLYELRRKSRYLVASPTEVLSEAAYDASGIPYSKVLPHLFGSRDDLLTACGYYMQHYRGMKHSILRSASITLIASGELDSLYRATRAVMKGKLPVVSRLPTDDIQAYHTRNVPNVFFDLGEVMKKAGNDSPAYPAFAAQLSRTVIYKASTEKIIDVLPIEASQCSGLSMYVPLEKWKGTNEYGYYFGEVRWSGVY